MSPVLSAGMAGDRIVGIRLEGEAAIRLYRRREGRTIAEEAEFYPFFFLGDASLLSGFDQHHWLKECSGKNPLRFIAAFQRWRTMWDAIHHIVRQNNIRTSNPAGSYAELDSILVRSDPVHQFLLQSGIVPFKGLMPEDLNIMSLAVVRSEPSPRKRELFEVRVLAVSFNSGEPILLVPEDIGPRAIIESLNRLIADRDPDIITGDAIFSEILPLLEGIAGSEATDLALGREDRSLRLVQTRDGTAYDAPGRWLIDPLQLAEFTGFGTGKLYDQSVEALASMITQSKAKQSPSPGSGPVSAAERKKKAIRAAVQAGQVTRAMIPHALRCATLFPIPLYRLLREPDHILGESILLRGYVAARHSVPMHDTGTKSLTTRSPYWVGVFDTVVETGIPSLLRHAMNRAKPTFKYSEPGVFEEWFELSTSGQAETAVPEEVIDHVRRTLLAAVEKPTSLFFDNNWIQTVDTERERMLGDIIRQVELHNGTVLQRRGSRLFVALPDNIVGESNERKLLERISGTLPDNLHLQVYRRFPRVISSHQQTLVILQSDDSITVTGQAFQLRGLEKFASRFIRQCVEAFLAGRISQLHHAFATYHTLIRTRQLPIADLARAETLREDIDVYQKSVQEHRRVRSAAYEAVLRSGRRPPIGTVISFYIAGNESEPIPVEHSRLAEEWDSSLRDENVPYYLSRLDEAALRFKDFFAPGDFRRIFSLDDLFAFSPDKINLLRTRFDSPGSDKPASHVPPPAHGIWLEGQSGQPSSRS